MAFDETLAARVRHTLGKQAGIVEKKMFGGVAFLLHGNMSVGVHGTELIVRVDPDEGERALAEPNVRRFDITGRPMKGWLLVTAAGLETDRALRRWVDAGLGFAASLPPKE
jgi:TfoX/Sxy family transcriptional regulator of competence genes